MYYVLSDEWFSVILEIYQYINFRYSSKMILDNLIDT